MKKRTKFLSRVFVTAVLATAPGILLAQSYMPPVSVPNAGSIGVHKYCDQKYVIGVTPENRVSNETVAACKNGQEEARIVAENFAGQNGKLHGYLEGFSYALYKASDATDDDAASVASGRASMTTSAGTQMQAGLQAGIDQGNRLGNPAGQSDALGIWQSAFESGELPAGQSNSHYRLDSIPGYQSDYRDAQGNVNAYEQIVGKLTVQKIMQEDGTLDAVRRLTVGFQSGEVIYLTQDRVYNIWDLWFNDGTYEVNRYKNGAWINNTESLKFWKDHYKDIAQYNTYDHLETNHQYQIVVGGAIVNKTANLKTEFNEGFLSSYTYYMHHNFRQKFHEFVGLGAVNGETTGIQVGKRIAFQNGLALEFNEQFDEKAQSTYRDAYVSAYTTKFDNKFYEYADNAKINIAGSVEVIGEDDDGIIQPGEKIKLKLTLQNKGGKDASGLKINITGDIKGSAGQALATLSKLDANTYETGFIAQIKEGHDVNRDAQINVALSGDNGASASTRAGVDIQNQVEPKGEALSSNIDTLNGTAVVTLPIQNISEVDTQDLTAEVVIGATVVGTETLGKLVAGERRTVSVRLSNLKPIAMISGLSAEIVIKADGKRIGGTTKNTTVKSANSTKDITKIFATIAKGQRVSNVTAEEAKAELLRLDSKQTRANKKGSNVYKKNSSTTIPGLLVDLKGSNEEAYNDIAVAMWNKNRKNLPAFLSGKRKAYRKLLDQLTIVGKVKKAAKGKK